MFGPTIEELRDVVDRLQAEVRAAEDGDVDWSVVSADLVALERERERVDHLIGLLVSDLAARGAHVRDGARNMATWLNQRTAEVFVEQATELVTIAQTMSADAPSTCPRPSTDV